MTAVDSSVCVAAFATWHASHRAAQRALAARPRLIAHAAFETYAVLTRLPPPQRARGDVVARFLSSNFPGPLIVLGAREQARLLQDLPAHGVTGGATYDALIAASAKQAGEELLTLDRRAVSTYEIVGVRFRLLS